ncbi:Gfo/Idh/MocA family protein [Coraliomargarita sp. W4R53]
MIVLKDADSPYFPLKVTHAEKAELGFRFSAAYAEHPHIYSQIDGLIEAGGELISIFDTNPVGLANLIGKYPHARVASSENELLQDGTTHMIVAAGIPCDRSAFGERVMRSGKDYFVAKTGFTSLDQIERIRQCLEETEHAYYVFFVERCQNVASWYLNELAHEGVFGDVVYVSATGPHKLQPLIRPDWFFDERASGGILCDICIHHIDQYLMLTGQQDYQITYARTANLAHPEFDKFEDFGELIIQFDSGVQCHSQVDWLTHSGLSAFGDGRTFLTGTKASVELRKYIDLGSEGGDTMIITDQIGTHILRLQGHIQIPYFSELIQKCVQRTHTSSELAHTLRVAEIAIMAQNLARNRGVVS